MGFRTTTEVRPVINVVVTAAGRITGQPGLSKVRAWVLDDRTVTLCYATGAAVQRVVIPNVEYATFDRRARRLTVTFDDREPIEIDAKGCAPCTMGAVANAGPIAGPYQVERVRADWSS